MMHDNQVQFDADIIRGMIIDQFLEYSHERIEPLGATSTDNTIFRLRSGVAARFPSRVMEPVECAITNRMIGNCTAAHRAWYRNQMAAYKP
jgi:hypothetical protein